MSVEVIPTEGSFYPDQSSPRQDFQSVLLDRTAMFQFVETQAINQLARTPQKDQLMLELTETIDSIANALTVQDEFFHAQASNGQLSEEMISYINHLNQQEQGLHEKIAYQANIVASTDPSIVQFIQDNLIESEEMQHVSVEAKVAQLASQFAGVQIVADNDGTLTTNPEEYLPFIPGSLIAEKRLAKHSRAAFPHIFVQNWQEVLRRAPHLFKLVGRELAKVRAGTFELFEETKKSQVPLVILTANFEPVANGVLQQNPKASDGIILWGVTHDDITSTEKEIGLRRLAYSQPELAVAYIGDGSSCLPTIQAQDIVLVYYALRGSTFEKELQKAQARYISYDTIHDVTDSMKRIGILQS